ncbi:PH domain-containing protein [Micromonospora sp. NPDC049523]|uniref:PH domain-containing protein n=1 Tax=Micromonospora sp. NPDC049523 TaxID=3155921 RepID=UPI003436F0CB
MSDDQQHTVTSLTVRPRRLRRISIVAAPIILVAYIWWGWTLSGTTSNGGALTEEDQWALMGLGPIVAALALLPLRLRVDADPHGVRVRGFHRDLTVPWTMVSAVRFNRTALWGSLVLTNSEPVQLLAIQIFDGPRAVAAIRQLRAIHAAAQADTSVNDRTTATAATSE